MPKYSLEAKTRHAKLITDISNYIAPGVDEYRYKQCKNSLRAFLNPLEQKESNDILDILKILESRGKIGVGNYDNIKDILKTFHVDLVEMIEDAVDDINKIESRQNEQSATSDFRSEREIEITSLCVEVTSPSAENHGIGKRVPVEPGTASPKKIAKIDKLKYPYEKGQKGLLVILNFKKDRPGSSQDVQKLQDLFEELNFEIEILKDLCKEELFTELKQVRDTLKIKRNAKKYYCFVMAIMGHGNKDGIRTADDDETHVPFDDIYAFFKNDVIEHFAGKPRLFLVQSCRGDEEQETVVLPDDRPLSVFDYVGKVTVPTDSDVLVAYATTPGNKAFRRLPLPGAWFIDAFTEVFRQDYKEDHVEEMLISVREKVALDPQYRTNTSKCQMPCTWTTFTKRLYFV